MFRALEGGAIGLEAGFDEAVELAAHFGFEGIGLDLGYLAENGPESVVQMLDERGLLGPRIPWTPWQLTHCAALESPSPRSRRPCRLSLYFAY